MNRVALKRVLEERLAEGPRTPRGASLRHADTRSGVTDSSLAAAYRRYWGLPETGPTEAFRAVYVEIARLEGRADPQVAWRTLREAATVHYTETGICPFCRERGALHLPAKQLSMELSEDTT